MSRALDNQRLVGICKVGRGRDTCRYIISGAGSFQCGKHTDYRAVIDKRVEDDSFTAKADNCEGLR